MEVDVFPITQVFLILRNDGVIVEHTCTLVIEKPWEG